MANIEFDKLPGFTGTAYMASLPKDMAANPNCQRAISRDLYEAVVGDRVSTCAEPLTLSDTDFSVLRDRVLTDLEQLGNPYHARLHTEEVLQCIEILTQMAAVPVDGKLLKVGGLFHDDGHCGGTYRQLRAGVERADMSNEEFSSLTADNYTRCMLSARQRLELQGLILATSFGQANAATLPKVEGVVLQRPYAPTTPAEKLLAFADIGRFMLGADHHLDGSLRMLEESGKVPESFETWLRGEKGFLGYVQMRLDQIKECITEDGARFLQGKLGELQTSFAAIEQESGAYGREFERVVARMKSRHGS